MVETLAGAIAAANGTMNLLKVAVSAYDKAKISAATAELTEKLRAVNESALSAIQDSLKLAQDLRALDQKAAELERENQQLKARADDLARYVLVSISQGVFAYTLKEPDPSGQPPHYLCQACVDRGHKVVLQRDGVSRNLKCPSCSVALRTEDLTDPPRARWAITDDEPESWKTR